MENFTLVDDWNNAKKLQNYSKDIEMNNVKIRLYKTSTAEEERAIKFSLFELLVNKNNYSFLDNYYITILNTFGIIQDRSNCHTNCMLCDKKESTVMITARIKLHEYPSPMLGHLCVNCFNSYVNHLDTKEEYFTIRR